MIEVPSGGRSRSLVPRSLDRVEERLILATCLVLAGVSVVGAIFEWPPAVYQPITFLALYAVLASCSRSGRPRRSCARPGWSSPS